MLTHFFLAHFLLTHFFLAYERAKNLRGAGWMLASAVMASFMSVAVKAAGAEIPSIQVTFLRCLLGALLILPLVVREHGHIWRSAHRQSLILRGLIICFAMNCGYYALANLELTTATMLFFTVPLLLTAMASLLLGEKIGLRRISALLIGFGGLLIILRPGIAPFDLVALIALLSSVAFAYALILGKQLSLHESSVTVVFYTLAITAMLSGGVSVFIWQSVSGTIWLILGVAALTGTSRAIFDFCAYREGEVSFVAPFQYTRILMIIFLAYFIFSEIPDFYTLLGGGVIISASIYVAWREMQLARQQGKKPAIIMNPPLMLK